MATDEADGLPERPVGVRGVGGAVPSRLDTALAPWPAPGAARAGGHRRGGQATATGASGSCSTPRTTMSVPAYLLIPDGRRSPGSAVLAVHGHGPGKSRVCGLDPDDRARARTTPPSWPDGAMWCWPPTCAASESGPTGTRPTTTPATPIWSIRSWGDGSPLTQNLWDLARALDLLEDHPLVDPARHRHGRLLLRGDDHPVPGRLRPPGVGGRGERLLLLVGRVAQGPVEHVRLPGALRPCWAGWSTSTWARWWPPAPCSSSPVERTCCSRWPTAEAVAGPPPAGLRPPRGRRPAGPRRPSTASTSGTGPRAYPFLDRWLGPTRRSPS